MIYCKEKLSKNIENKVHWVQLIRLINLLSYPLTTSQRLQLYFQRLGSFTKPLRNTSAKGATASLKKHVSTSFLQARNNSEKGTNEIDSLNSAGKKDLRVAGAKEWHIIIDTSSF